MSLYVINVVGMKLLSINIVLLPVVENFRFLIFPRKPFVYNTIRRTMASMNIIKFQDRRFRSSLENNTRGYHLTCKTPIVEKNWENVFMSSLKSLNKCGCASRPSPTET